MRQAQKKRHSGFTLAELLIALGLLGVIATYTIPKVLATQENHRYRAVAKELAAAVSEAYMAYQMKNKPTESTSLNDLTPYLNYLKVETDSLAFVDKNAATPGGFLGCSSAIEHCLRFHNGATLRHDDWGNQFGGTGSTNAVTFIVDPDGDYTGTRPSVQFWLYYNGRITTEANKLPNTCVYFSGCSGPTANADPTWFSW
jgi:prepilin-type N-terminal cleavage/methylation domain-containing protein